MPSLVFELPQVYHISRECARGFLKKVEKSLKEKGGGEREAQSAGLSRAGSMASAFLRGALPCAKRCGAVGARTGRALQNGFAQRQWRDIGVPSAGGAALVAARETRAARYVASERRHEAKSFIRFS